MDAKDIGKLLADITTAPFEIVEGFADGIMDWIEGD